MKRQKITPQEVKESYNRVSKNATGLRLKFIKKVALEVYLGCQNFKNN